jgi:uncharacterized membrane protein
MRKIISKLKFVFQYIVSSIGFYPTLISLIFFVFSILMLFLERNGLSARLLDSNLGFMIITHGETAGLILSSITSGIISLTVFSFAMVMLVLSQASSNFSPRVIPGIISKKSNQIVLGIYLGTLIYSLVIMVNIRSDSYSQSLPGFAIFVAMCFTISSLALFVYFIHSISQSIQIGNILQGIYNMTRKSLINEIEDDNSRKAPNAFQNAIWYDINSPQTGYLQSIDKDALLRVCKKYDVIIDFNAPLGNFIVNSVPFARIDKFLTNEDELVKEIQNHLNFYREERPDLNYLFGFKHITESAVKALSPGINDPGTAKKGIEYLTALFALRMELTDEKVMLDDTGAARIRFQHETFKNLFKACIGPIRLYGKEDPKVLLEILSLIKILSFKAQNFSHLYPVLLEEAKYILADAEKSVSGSGDKQMINEIVASINQDGYLPEPLPYLTRME